MNEAVKITTLDKCITHAIYKIALERKHIHHRATLVHEAAKSNIQNLHPIEFHV
jgi:hypothetical protein